MQTTVLVVNRNYMVRETLLATVGACGYFPMAAEVGIQARDMLRNAVPCSADQLRVELQRRARIAKDVKQMAADTAVILTSSDFPPYLSVAWKFIDWLTAKRIRNKNAKNAHP